MGLYIDHVNVVLSKLRENSIASLVTNADTEAFKAQIAVQRAVNRIWNAKKWTFKQRRDTLALTSGTALYTFPKQIGETYSLRSLDTSNVGKKVDVVSEDIFDLHIPDPTQSGWPVIMTIFDMLGASNDPSSASVLTLSSSSATDTSQFVTVRGIVGGEIDVEEIALDGTTSVSTNKSFTRIFSIGKNATTVGRITITSNSAAVTIAVLSPQEKTIKIRQFRAYPTPDATYTIQFKFFAIPPILTSRYQDAEIPHRWDYIIDQYAFALALQAKGKEQIEEFVTQMQLADKMVGQDMTTEESLSSETIIVPQRALTAAFLSNFAWPPSGTGFTEEGF